MMLGQHIVAAAAGNLTHTAGQVCRPDWGICEKGDSFFAIASFLSTLFTYTLVMSL